MGFKLTTDPLKVENSVTCQYIRKSDIEAKVWHLKQQLAFIVGPRLEFNEHF